MIVLVVVFEQHGCFVIIFMWAVEEAKAIENKSRSK